MKKFTCLLLCAVLLACFAGCAKATQETVDAAAKKYELVLEKYAEWEAQVDDLSIIFGSLGGTLPEGIVQQRESLAAKLEEFRTKIEKGPEKLSEKEGETLLADLDTTLADLEQNVEVNGKWIVEINSMLEKITRVEELDYELEQATARVKELGGTVPDEVELAAVALNDKSNEVGGAMLVMDAGTDPEDPYSVIEAYALVNTLLDELIADYEDLVEMVNEVVEAAEAEQQATSGVEAPEDASGTEGEETPAAGAAAPG